MSDDNQDQQAAPDLAILLIQNPDGSWTAMESSVRAMGSGPEPLAALHFLSVAMLSKQTSVAVNFANRIRIGLGLHPEPVQSSARPVAPAKRQPSLRLIKP